MDMTPSIRLAGTAGSRSGHAGGITLDGLIQEISECYEIVQMHDNTGTHHRLLVNFIAVEKRPCLGAGMRECEGGKAACKE